MAKDDWQPMDTFTADDENAVAAELNAAGQAIAALEAIPSAPSLPAAATLAEPLTTAGTAETKVLSLPVPANTVAAGTTFRITAFFTTDTTDPRTFVGYIGTTGTPTDAAIVGGTIPVPANNGAHVDMLITIRSLGSTGTVNGNMSIVINSGALVPMFANTVPVDTTAKNFVTLTMTAQTAGVLTAQNAVIQQVA
jgi:hypothetical protein